MNCPFDQVGHTKDGGHVPQRASGGYNAGNRRASNQRETADPAKAEAQFFGNPLSEKKLATDHVMLRERQDRYPDPVAHWLRRFSVAGAPCVTKLLVTLRVSQMIECGQGFIHGYLQPDFDVLALGGHPFSERVAEICLVEQRFVADMS
ncbi:MAG: hypothetical protein DI569_09875 [Sphingopyxis macrogoltabida]|uniref:Uncharacterized protein n=1 Tax=Sphingopyxis macrogoltabida TaxID=33050 RepID=A0A2W5N6Z6_SPHMC|nr:MAG: hypothetical protein DI569_09875 [Sphingopyxis macrogoltabida]